MITTLTKKERTEMEYDIEAWERHIHGEGEAEFIKQFVAQEVRTLVSVSWNSATMTVKTILTDNSVNVDYYAVRLWFEYWSER